MRVISGTCKGRPLKAVPGTLTRPTTDKVKESIFNIIGPYFKGGQALDLYAGSGGLGIEALSRGIDNVIFVDHNPKAVEIIKLNLKNCRFEDKVEVYRNESMRALKAIAKRKLKFDLIFLDPPYAKQRLEDEIDFIVKNDLLSQDGIIVTEHDANVSISSSIDNLSCYRQEHYGDTGITIYKMM
ncbi:16S rRNA (guanine(966)-N(2))-methyltransferase RsmD [Anaerobacillus alkalidiazotrophicus]|uniref:16S rRNA (Guanine(966)-N(2))-methyltransferase RsmD n=1 Tax=Anaerobacillus alkalidiazotrophicus TaxID=472963 RepID=A0A1S2M181_9BACI|nr:16S rRNA (guanine(966)-N(2))-methyltransferase RsmD [Anaerobacillus alkalidiazotrophicus]OIJ17727.1 16S rRNA (guanine(966)-N(2))-methyltransferase RsmD [Anaerobacillus alkalidiazotrophicus]